MEKATPETTVMDAAVIAVAARQRPLATAAPMEVAPRAGPAPNTAPFTVAAAAAGPGLQTNAQLTLAPHVRQRVAEPRGGQGGGLGPRVSPVTPGGRGPTILGPLEANIAIITRQSGPMPAIKMGRARTPTIGHRSLGGRVAPRPDPVIPTARAIHDVATLVGEPVRKAEEVEPAGLPATSGMAGVLVAPMDATVPGGAAATEEAVPGVVPPGETPDAVRDPPVLIAAAPGPPSASPRPPDAVASAVRPTGDAALEALALRLELATRLGPTAVIPETGSGPAVVGA